VNPRTEEEEPPSVAALARCAHPRIRLASSAARRNRTDGAWARWPLPDPPWPWDSPGPTRTLHEEEYQSIKIGVPFPRVHSSLLDLPGLHQVGLHRRRSTRPRDLSPSLTMRCRPRGHPRCRQLRSVLPTSRPSFQRSPLHRVQAEESTPVPTSPWSLRSAAASRARVPPSWFLTTLAACSSSTLSEFSSEFQSWGS
jgi:hypothetical protein